MEKCWLDDLMSLLCGMATCIFPSGALANCKSYSQSWILKLSARQLVSGFQPDFIDSDDATVERVRDWAVSLNGSCGCFFS